jgi:hypothetical protein
MTPAETRIEFAERLGWKKLEVFEASFSDPSKQVSRGLKWHDPNGHQRNLPDSTDHNHVHAALMGMSEDEWENFCTLLYEKLEHTLCPNYRMIFYIFKTPLATLVECFLSATKGRVK